MKALISAFALLSFGAASALPMASASAAQSKHSTKHHKKRAAGKRHHHKRVAHSKSKTVPSSGMKRLVTQHNLSCRMDRNVSGSSSCS
jgi:hypothetical protein